MTNTSDSIRMRGKLIAVWWFPLAAFLIFRFFQIQVTRHEYYFSEARGRYTTSRTMAGKRGEIFDRSGYLLVGNSPCVEIFCTPANLPENSRRSVAVICAKHFGKPAMWYYRRLAPVIRRKGPDGVEKEVRSLYFMINRQTPLETAEAFKRELTRLFQTEKERAAGKTTARHFPPGFIAYRNSSYRTYPKGRLASNILGYINVVNDSAVPQGGLEKELNKTITPEMGREIYERTRDGIPLDYGYRKFSESRDGKDVYLTISEPVQAILEEELDAAYAKWRPETIYAAIADPNTGEILALAQRPTFNPGDRKTFDPAAVRTRIAEDSYEPGSVIKPFSIGKALDWGVVTPDTVIDCEKGRWIYLKRPLTDSHNYDKLTVAGVIQKSSNIGTAKVALSLGKERVYEVLRLFGFGEKTGLPFPLESRGYLPRPKRWDGLSITRFPIGYGIRVSPLQLLRAYCALACNGDLPELKLVDRLVDTATGEETRRPVRIIRRTFVNPAAHRQLVDMMVTVTEPGGTATKAAVPGYRVAGKTGTSRKYVPGRGYSAGAYFASFVGFVPAYKPRLVMLVTFDNPKGASYGGTIAGPVFSRTASRILKYWNVPPDRIPEKKGGPKK